ncbi:MAG: xanthine phosphoribosyltransferase [Clostridia bacterium]|nr:xanthine phosphoribosyltransferase [Clostridia bacterium]
MELLKQRILKDGIVKPGGILKVDSFLNHCIDVGLYNEIGKEFRRLFDQNDITKILTIEASGIGIACVTAQYFNVPVVFAKKSISKNLDGDLLVTQVKSFTKGTVYDVIVSKRFLNSSDNVLIIDDFLANGMALQGLIDLCNKSGAQVAGAGIVIEKAFQNGGKIIRDMGIRVESLARIASMDANKVVFED